MADGTTHPHPAADAMAPLRLHCRTCRECGDVVASAADLNGEMWCSACDFAGEAPRCADCGTKAPAHTLWTLLDGWGDEKRTCHACAVEAGAEGWRAA